MSMSPQSSEPARELQRLTRLHGAELSHYAQRLIPTDLRRTLDPQDVVQDVFFEAFQRLAEFTSHDPDSARRWLKTIARNRLTDLVRRHRAAKRGSGQLIEEVHHGSVIALLQDLAVYERTPSRSAVSHEMLALMLKLLDRLEPDQKQAIRLRYIQGLSFNDAAERMGRTDGALRMLVSRGLRAIRGEFGSISLSV
jgi:RNA polymerase sigma-70 factor (ECF subfamily)